MPDIFQRTSTITTLSPLRAGTAGELQRTLRAMGADSPFAVLPRTRFARWAVVTRDWPTRGGGDPWRSDYLLWIATVDGPLEPFLWQLAGDAGAPARAVWRPCVGWPAGEAPAAVVAYLLRARIPVDMYLAFHADVTRADIDRAVALQAALRRLAQRTPDLSDQELQQEYAATVEP